MSAGKQTFGSILIFEGQYHPLLLPGETGEAHTSVQAMKVPGTQAAPSHGDCHPRPTSGDTQPIRGQAMSSVHIISIVPQTWK